MFTLALGLYCPPVPLKGNTRLMMGGSWSPPLQLNFNSLENGFEMTNSATIQTASSKFLFPKFTSKATTISPLYCYKWFLFKIKCCSLYFILYHGFKKHIYSSTSVVFRFDNNVIESVKVPLNAIQYITILNQMCYLLTF